LKHQLLLVRQRGLVHNGPVTAGSDPRHYFAYGSNMLRRQMQARCPGSRFVGPARLRGHRLAFTRRSLKWQGGVADIIPATDAETWGGLFEVSSDHVAALDVAEGHPLAYERRMVVVETLSGAPVDAWVYVVVDKVSSVVPTLEYWQAMVDGAVDCELPGEYLAMLRALRHSG